MIGTLGNIEINECLQFYDKWVEYGCRGGKVTISYLENSI